MMCIFFLIIHCVSVQRNARRTADRKYMETLKKSGIDYDRLRQSSVEGSRAVESNAGCASDDDDRNRSVDVSPDRSSAMSADRESSGRESHSHRSRREGSRSPSAPEYTQEDADSVVDEDLDT